MAEPQQVNAINNSPFRELLTYMMEDPRSITYCTIKNLERMGDQHRRIRI